MNDCSKCTRCGVECQGSETANPDARLLRRAKRGLCVDCATTQFLKQTETVAWALSRQPEGPRVLLSPPVQESFAALMRIGGAEASPAEINWGRIVENWDL